MNALSNALLLVTSLKEKPLRNALVLEIQVSHGDYDRVETIKTTLKTEDQVVTALTALAKHKATRSREALSEEHWDLLGEDFIPRDDIHDIHDNNYAELESYCVTYFDEHSRKHKVELR